MGMKNPIPDFLRPDYPLTPANIRPQADRDVDRLLQVAEDKGYPLIVEVVATEAGCWGT